MSAETNRPVRVLHVLGRMQRGGAETRTLDVLRRLDPRRVRADFCVLSGRSGPLDGEVEALGGRVHRVGLGPAFPFRFVSLLRREGYDVVHSHVHLFSGAVLALARTAGTPRRIAHFRSTDDGRGRSLPRRATRWVMRTLIDIAATDVLGVCAAALAAGWGGRRAGDPRGRVVYNGIDLGRSPGIADPEGVRAEFGLGSGPLCIHVGRFDPPKNHLRLLEIFAALRRLEPGASLLLVGRGGGEIETRARQLIAERGLQGAVAVAGERDDVRRLMASADLMIFPSLWEGLPGAVLEALAAGLPVLASDLPGVCEIRDESSGLTALSLADDDRTWAETASTLLRTAPKASLESGGPFDVSVCAETMMSIWRGKP